MSDLKSECQEINNWFIKNTFQYEIPHCFTASYKNDKAYLSILSTNIGLVTSRPILQNYRPIKIYHIDGPQPEYTEVLFKSVNQEIVFDYVSISRVFDYNVRLQMSWYMLSPKNIKAHTINFHNFINGGYRNYLIVPIINDQIDYEFMQEFIKQREGLVNGLCLKDLNLDDQGIADQLFYIPKTQQVNCIYAIISQPWKQTVDEYFNLIIQNSKFTLEQLKEYYCIDETILKKTIGYFFYEHQFKAKTENINPILQLRSYQNQFNQRDSALAIFKQVTTIQRVQFYSEDQINSLENKSQNLKIHTCKPKLELNSLSTHIMPISNLYRYPFTVNQYDNFLMLPTFLLELEQQFIISEFANSIGIEPNLRVQRAISRASYNRDINYELLETLGDSILKYLATVSVSLGPQNTNENILSDQRSQIVNNNFIGKHLFKYQYFGLFHYVRSLGHQTKWFSPVLQNIHSNHIQPEPIKQVSATMLVTFLADIFESLIATVFLDKDSLYDVYKFLLHLRHPVSYYPATDKYYPRKPIVQQYQFPIMHNYMSFKDLINPVRQLSEAEKQYFQKNQLEYLNYLQTEVIEYQFHNKYILYESFRVQGSNMDLDLPLELYYKFLLNSNTPSTRGHQMLELIGDAVLECYIMCNCFNQIIFKFTPTNLYKIKMVLLSNSFLSKIAICYNIMHNFQDTAILQFIETVKLDEKFTYYNGNFVRVPKVLSDTFEALVGAIFMDGGWQPVCKFLKKVYLKFIPFVCTYLNDIDDHVIDRVHQYSASKQGHMDIKSFKQENGQFCYEIRIDGQIVGRFTHEHERVAKEKACESACKKLKI
ncbi:unnamed protein product (macronuclear) [Paramecium tetraurelia]|uniref:RNase III domain-containing protein n=1 Tax=Paramecium tetraurelia TaxID=5888 RepID=A0DYG6_PARTE|nr:uncharacterized protein GSPATT00003051001 [Paramecium tetraurelia]CAK88083.1 unnamed protein product [Paramecium tetraurelia]|eukprot:XP_001455480.1 hypothetical protein (macronuclear) [Paramecium tetraurelia strain d4-2]